MTQTEICNHALAILGHDRQISSYESDTSTEAERCREFFDSALGDCLSAHDWDFASVERNLGTVHPDEHGWTRVPWPDDAIRIVLVSDPEGHPFQTRRDRDFLYVRSEGLPARIRYVSSDIDVGSVPSAFSDAVAYRLAYIIAGPMFGDASKADGFAAIATRKLSEAISRETDETAYRGEWRNPFLEARR